MEEAIDGFFHKLRGGGAGLFYYAGHGIQVAGSNYLIPVDARVSSEADVKYNGVNVGLVLGKMQDAGNELNIVILDACRDNPFSRSFRTTSRGLARMDSPRGSFIAYATAPGGVAADGSGRNGIFTKHLLTHLATPGLKVEEVFKRVAIEVDRETRGSQLPWRSSSLIGDFYFFTGGESLAVASRPPPKPLVMHMGSLQVQTRPTGAVVQIEGKRYGESPLTIEGLAPRSYKVRAHKNGYKALVEHVRIRAGGQTELIVVLEAEETAGNVVVGSEPSGIKWFSDGKHVGTTPNTMKKITPNPLRMETKKRGEGYLTIVLDSNDNSIVSLPVTANDLFIVDVNGTHIKGNSIEAVSKGNVYALPPGEYSLDVRLRNIERTYRTEPWNPSVIWSSAPPIEDKIEFSIYDGKITRLFGRRVNCWNQGNWFFPDKRCRFEITKRENKNRGRPKKTIKLPQ
jgi:hypothetical protein